MLFLFDNSRFVLFFFSVLVEWKTLNTVKEFPAPQKLQCTFLMPNERVKFLGI